MELAWMLGALAGGGTVRANVAISLTKYNEYLQKKFTEIGIALFKVNAAKTAVGYSVFYNVAIAQELGDLRRNRWPETIRKQHSWLLEDPQYTWAFLEGIFDTRGSFQKHSKGLNHSILIATPHMPTAIFITELLSLVGIKNPDILSNKKNVDIPQSVQISSFDDIKLFAENVHATIPEREALLELYRSSTPDSPRQVSTKDVLVTEWIRLSNLLGYSPSSNEIDRLRANGLTRWSSMSYRSQIGNGSFVKASETLKRIVEGTDLTS